MKKKNQSNFRLDEELLQEIKELAKKTGIEAFNNFHSMMLQDSMKLSTLYQNFTDSIKYSKITDKDERKKTKSAWDLFLSLIDGKTTIEQITLTDIKAYEKYLHKKK